jgi:hypothetical protein
MHTLSSADDQTEIISPSTLPKSRGLRTSALRPVLYPLVDFYRCIAFLSAVSQGKCAAPPHRIKLRVILSRLRAMDRPIFVETGTYFGDTISAVNAMCSTALSIEIDPYLFARACQRFRNNPRVRILHGDCVEILPRIIADLQRPALFWLDAHYSAGLTSRGRIDDPIMLTLEQLNAQSIRSHVLLIDDASSFDGREARPDLPDVLKLLRKINQRYRLSIIHNIIVAEP